MHPQYPEFFQTMTISIELHGLKLKKYIIYSVTFSNPYLHLYPSPLCQVLH